MTELQKTIFKKELFALLASNPATEGMVVQVRGSSFILGRQDPDPNGPYSSPEPDERLRLTDLGRSRFSLSVRRHTGRWEKTPFTGTLPQLVDAICATMPHIAAGP
jgi:hypothetical protein